MNTIQTTEPILSTADAMDDMNAVLAGHASEVSDATARTIASWWQSPGAVGCILAALASGRPVERGDLLDDISATARDAKLPGWTSTTGTRASQQDADSLNLLSTWTLNHV